MIGWLAWVWVGHASPVFLDSVRPVAAPWDVMEQYARWSAGAGTPGEIHCDPVWGDQVRLCFRFWDGKTRRWVEVKDLAREGLTSAELRDQVIARGGAVLNAMETKQVEGMEHTYWQLRDGDGWGVVAALQPGELARAMGAKGRVHVAMPSQGVLLAWPEGSPELDHVMVVGVREMYDQMSDPVSPVVHTWDGSGWAVLGEAKPEPATEPSSSSSG